MAEQTKQGVFITGGCGDIGRAVAARFLRGGARVVLADVKDAAKGAEVARSLHATDASYVGCDVRRSASVDAAVAAAAKTLGRLDVAICNAGAPANGRVVEITDESWQTNIDIYLTGSFYTARAAARIMLGQPRNGAERRGAILFTGTWVQALPWPGNAGYCSSKAGQELLMKVMAQELAGEGITCNAVAPGMVNAGLCKLAVDNDPVFRRQALAAVPLGRLSTAEEVAGAFYFLAGPEATYVTGTTLLVDGGASLIKRD